MSNFRLAPRSWLGLRSEQGIALPAAVMMLFIVSTLMVVVASQAITSDSQSRRDRGVKRGVAAADAGVDAGLYRLNKLKPLPNQCVTINQGTGDLQVQGAGSNGWCPAQTESLGDGASYSYEMSTAKNVTVNGQALYQRRLVSTGVVNGVKRRVMTVIGASTGKPLVGDYALLSLSDVNLGQATRVQGNLGTNGNVSLSQAAEVCGNITYGIGKTYSEFNTAHQCPGYTRKAATQPFVLSSVQLPKQNNNGSINNPGWNSTTRVLSMSDGTLTLTGDNYVFCKLELTNTAQLVIGLRAPGAQPLRIYIDAPENCTDASNPDPVRVSLRNSASISNLNQDPMALTMYSLGSTTGRTTKLEFSQSVSTQLPMIVYAPRSIVELANTSSILGAVAAKDVRILPNASIVYDPRVALLTLDDVLPQYFRQSWVECRVARTDAAVPDSGC
jgi:hypothetical protein